MEMKTRLDEVESQLASKGLTPIPKPSNFKTTTGHDTFTVTLAIPLPRAPDLQG